MAHATASLTTVGTQASAAPLVAAAVSETWLRGVLLVPVLVAVLLLLLLVLLV